MRKIEKVILEDIEIFDAGAEGVAVGRYGEKIVFVKNAVPGDVVDVLVTRKKKSFIEGKMHALKKASTMREVPFCSHFGLCGGCKWQNLKYEHQLFFKQKQVTDSIQRIGKFEVGEMLPILGSERTTFYRNKLEYTFSRGRWLTDEDMKTPTEDRNMNALGFHLPQHFDRVLDIDFCYLQDEPSNKLRNSLREYSIKKGLAFYDARQQQGFLRNLVIRTGLSGEVMIIAVFGFEDEEERVQFLDYIVANFPEITSLFYIINTKRNDTISDQLAILYHGSPVMTETMEDLAFRIGPLSFFQTNPTQAYQLYKIVREFAQAGPEDVIYDLYTGTGTIANFVARQANKVVGIEYIESAITDAKENAAANNITNALFIAGDIAKTLNETFVNEYGSPDIIITDPPRAGMHKDVVDQIIRIRPRRVVYVSCNPATQARDVALMQDFYTIEKVQPVDMFPHTQHVENVMLLIAK
ncbi:MAG: 23S rRNA (uracil(1939)-C(5))-methyltransferase RlmD [Bacteroidota bacterium]